ADFFHHRADDPVGRLLRRLGDHALERQQRADQRDGGHYLAERLRLEEELAESFFLDGVALNDGDDVAAEVAADVAEPRRQPRRRGAQAGAALAAGARAARAARAGLPAA